MTTAQVVETNSQLPVVQVLNAESFVGPYLAQSLQAQRLQVITATHPPVTPDYIFYFSDSVSEIRSFLHTVPHGAKVLIAHPLDLDLNLTALLSLHPNLRFVIIPPHLYGPGIDLSHAGILCQLLIPFNSSSEYLSSLGVLICALPWLSPISCSLTRSCSLKSTIL